MATKKTTAKKTATKPQTPVEKLSTSFRVKWGDGVDDLFNDYYDFWVENDGNIRIDDLYFESSKKAVTVLRDMAQFLESYNEKFQAK